LRFADKCIFRTMDSTLIYATNVTTFGGDDRVLCELFPSATIGLNAMKVSIRNIFNDTSNEKTIDFYSKKCMINLIKALPEIKNLTLYSGLSSGGYSIGVHGTFDNFPLYCKFGSVPCLTQCTRVNGSYAVCPGFLFIF
jgi:hypothetical protein